MFEQAWQKRKDRLAEGHKLIVDSYKVSKSNTEVGGRMMAKGSEILNNADQNFIWDCEQIDKNAELNKPQVNISKETEAMKRACLNYKPNPLSNRTDLLIPGPIMSAIIVVLVGVITVLTVIWGILSPL
jgi:hypothetical protein